MFWCFFSGFLAEGVFAVCFLISFSPMVSSLWSCKSPSQPRAKHLKVPQEPSGEHKSLGLQGNGLAALLQLELHPTFECPLGHQVIHPLSGSVPTPRKQIKTNQFEVWRCLHDVFDHVVTT